MSDGSFPGDPPSSAPVPPPPPPYPGVPQPPVPQPGTGPFPGGPPPAPGFEPYPTAPPPGYGYTGGPMPGFAPQQSRTTKLGVAALVLGVLSIPLFFIVVPGLLALIFGLVGARAAKRSNGAITGRGLARAGWILGALSLIGFAVFVTLIATGVIDDGEIEVTELEVGQCVDLDDGDDAEIFSLPEIPCDEPHDGEVYFVADVTGFGDAYPGATDLQRAVEEQCIGAPFSDYIGADFLDSELTAYTLSPSEELWDDGDREFACIALSADGSDLVGTVRGANR